MHNLAYHARDIHAYAALMAGGLNDTARLFTLPLADTAPRTGRAVLNCCGCESRNDGLPAIDYIDLIERSER